MKACKIVNFDPKHLKLCDRVFQTVYFTNKIIYKKISLHRHFNVKIHAEDQTGPKGWSEKLSLNKDVWTRIFKSLKNICKETKLKEFQFKLIHRTIVTRKELFRFGVKTDDQCLYCGDKDSVEHSLVECVFTNIAPGVTTMLECHNLG